MRICILFFCLCQVAFAQPLFEKGNNLYRDGKYQEAATAYEQILESGKFSADLYFNLGNTYYKLGKVAPSIYNYEMALRLKPEDVDIKNNLKFAEQLRIDDIKVVEEAGFWMMTRDVLPALDYNDWAILAALAVVFFSICFAIYFFSLSRLFRKFSFGAGVAALLIGVFCVSIAQIGYKSDLSKREAIIYSDYVPVKSEPKAQSADAFALHAGTKVKIIQNLDRWFQIELPNGNEGWVLASEVREIKIHGRGESRNAGKQT